MIQRGTILTVADNSGAKKLNVIGIPGYSMKKFGKLGDVVTCSVRGTIGIATNIDDHKVVRAVLVRCKKETRRKYGTYIRFDDNAAVIIDSNKKPRGTRVFGPIAREVKEHGFDKIVSLAKVVW